MKSTAFHEPASLSFPRRTFVAHRGSTEAANLEELWDRSTTDSPADVARLTGIGGWLLWKIVTLWISSAVFGLVAFGARAQNSRQASMVCFFYAVFAGITAYMLQTKKPGAVIVASMFCLLTGNILWLIYFVVSRRVKYTYAGGESTRPLGQDNGDVLIRLLSTVHQPDDGIK